MLQNNQVLSFFRASERGDWNQRELAEFYRVEDALTKSGVAISTDRGLTDEGEPWFVFCRQDDEEVIVHFARIGGEYVVASNFTEAVFRGRNFQTLVRELLDSRPYVLPHSSRSTVFLHPAALLAALVVTAYVKSSELNAAAEDGSRPEKSFGWFLNRHDLAATYSAIVIASVWDSLAIDSSASKPSDDFASLDHAQPAHGEHGPDIQQAFVSDSLLQNIQLFQGADDRSVLTAALDLDGQDAVHNVNGPAIAGLVASASSLHPESSHHDNAAASSAHDVFRAENLDSKLADFGPQQGDFPIAASEQVERTVTHNPVSSSAPSNPTPDHPASQHNSTAPTTDGTSTGEPAAQAKHGTSTNEPAAQAKHGTSTGEPAAQAKHGTSTNEPAAEAKHSNEPADQAKHGTSTGEPAAEAKHVRRPTSRPLRRSTARRPASRPLRRTARPTSRPIRPSTSRRPTSRPLRRSTARRPASRPLRPSTARRPTSRPLRPSTARRPTSRPLRRSTARRPASRPLRRSTARRPTNRPLRPNTPTSRPIRRSTARRPTSRPLRPSTPTSRPIRRSTARRPASRPIRRSTARRPASRPLRPSTARRPTSRPLRPSTTRRPTSRPLRRSTARRPASRPIR